MKPFGGYIPKDQMSGDEEYVEFYRAEDVHNEIKRLEKELQMKDEQIQQQAAENDLLKKQVEELQAQSKTARVVAEDHGREIHKTKDVIEKLRESLEFYAQKSNWITMHDKESDPDYGKFIVESDQGQRARQTLELTENTDT